MASLEELKSNIAVVREKIEEGCILSGREVDAVTLIAVSKTQSSEDVAAAQKCGITSFGENKAQELIVKADELGDDIDWHFIGQIQTNKLKKIASRVSHIHSIDDTRQLDVLATIDNKPKLLLQLSSDGNPDRGGVTFDRIEPLRDYAISKDLEVVGIMHVPPAGEDPRSHFENAALCAQKLELPEVSMGMSHDYALAVELGSTMVRVGSAIFGSRLYQ